VTLPPATRPIARRCPVEYGDHQADQQYPLTWAQRSICRTMEGLGSGSSYLNIRRILDLPAGLAVEQVLTALTDVFAQHEALRSLVQRQDGRRYQLVTGRAQLSVKVLSVPEREAVPEVAPGVEEDVFQSAPGRHRPG